eukprot:1161652-Pelagomonas_calceolata.AAC.7
MSLKQCDNTHEVICTQHKSQKHQPIALKSTLTTNDRAKRTGRERTTLSGSVSASTRAMPVEAWNMSAEEAKNSKYPAGMRMQTGTQPRALDDQEARTQKKKKQANRIKPACPPALLSWVSGAAEAQGSQQFTKKSSAQPVQHVLPAKNAVPANQNPVAPLQHLSRHRAAPQRCTTVTLIKAQSCTTELHHCNTYQGTEQHHRDAPLQHLSRRRAAPQRCTTATLIKAQSSTTEIHHCNTYQGAELHHRAAPLQHLSRHRAAPQSCATELNHCNTYQGTKLRHSCYP